MGKLLLSYSVLTTLQLESTWKKNDDFYFQHLDIKCNLQTIKLVHQRANENQEGHNRDIFLFKTPHPSLNGTNVWVNFPNVCILYATLQNLNVYHKEQKDKYFTKIHTDPIQKSLQWCRSCLPLLLLLQSGCKVAHLLLTLTTMAYLPLPSNNKKFPFLILILIIVQMTIKILVYYWK